MVVRAPPSVRRVVVAVRPGTVASQAVEVAALGWVAVAVWATVAAWATADSAREAVAASERAKGLEQGMEQSLEQRRQNMTASSERWWRRRCPPTRCRW